MLVWLEEITSAKTRHTFVGSNVTLHIGIALDQ
ncbi:MAG: hypothetical protein M2R46_00703 [Verrucomicrobia subdivision 3 bacterium]|nr:hypothetical protein [Limisphaerales bacterium]